MKLTTIITDCTNPYVNLAAEELLTMNGGPDEVILYLWQKRQYSCNRQEPEPVAGM